MTSLVGTYPSNFFNKLNIVVVEFPSFAEDGVVKYSS